MHNSYIILPFLQPNYFFLMMIRQYPWSKSPHFQLWIVNGCCALLLWQFPWTQWVHLYTITGATVATRTTVSITNCLAIDWSFSVHSPCIHYILHNMHWQ